jgi:hypothetical protein
VLKVPEKSGVLRLPDPCRTKRCLRSEYRRQDARFPGEGSTELPRGKGNKIRSVVEEVESREYLAAIAVVAPDQT